MLILEDIKNRLKNVKAHNYTVNSFVEKRDDKYYVKVSYYLRLPNQVESEPILEKCPDGAFIFLRTHDRGIFNIIKEGGKIETRILSAPHTYTEARMRQAEGNKVNKVNTVGYNGSFSTNRIYGPISISTATLVKSEPYKRKSSIKTNNFLFGGFDMDCKSKTLHIVKEYELMHFLTINNGNYWGFLSNEWDKTFVEIRTSIIAAKAAKLSSDWDDLTSNKKIYHKKASQGFDEYYVLNEGVKITDSTRINQALADSEKSKELPF